MIKILDSHYLAGQTDNEAAEQFDTREQIGAAFARQLRSLQHFALQEH